MFEKLKLRWKVGTLNLILILCTFALGGSLCGYLGRKLMDFVGLENGFLWILFYIIIMTILWPACVLLISIPFGQYSFFTSYLKKMAGRFIRKQEKTTSIAIFASGAGSNAEKIIRRFNLPANDQGVSNNVGGKKNSRSAAVSLVVCNKQGAGVIQVAESFGIDSLLIEKERFLNGDHYLPILRDRNIDFIVLAGFLWKIPPELIRAYPDRIVNIHPALLPAYGGKGMYGKKVHEAVLAAKEMQSGITIHFVDELYDHGKVILQVNCQVDEHDTAESLAQKIHLLEHEHFPVVIEQLVNAK